MDLPSHPLLRPCGALLLLTLGEGLAVYAEIDAACRSQLPGWRPWAWPAGCMAVAGVMLLSGYALCMRAFGNLWTVSALSITAVLVAEPLFTWLLSCHRPGPGALIGLGAGAIGMAATLLLP